MYYQNYEDYMKNILSYNVENKDTYTYKINSYEDRYDNIKTYQDTKELEEYYPQIYKIINPVVLEICNKYTKPISKDVFENIVEEIYKKIELNVEIRKVSETEIRQRRPNNSLLRDLIRILILNQILERNITSKPFIRDTFQKDSRTSQNINYDNYFKF